MPSGSTTSIYNKDMTQLIDDDNKNSVMYSTLRSRLYELTAVFLHLSEDKHELSSNMWSAWWPSNRRRLPYPKLREQTVNEVKWKSIPYNGRTFFLEGVGCVCKSPNIYAVCYLNTGLLGTFLEWSDIYTVFWGTGADGSKTSVWIKIKIIYK